MEEGFSLEKVSEEPHFAGRVELASAQYSTTHVTACHWTMEAGPIDVYVATVFKPSTRISSTVGQQWRLALRQWLTSCCSDLVFDCVKTTKP